MSQNLTIRANFRTAETLPTIEIQYRDLWKLAVFFDSIGLPVSEWYPPADTEEHSLLNAAFDVKGPTTAALALAKADKSNQASDLRDMGVWNGMEGIGGMAFTVMFVAMGTPSFFNLSENGISAFKKYENIVALIRVLVETWKPMLITVSPEGYDEYEVFPDRPGAGWMIYLPLQITASQLPEAALLIPIVHDDKTQGTIVVSTTECFQTSNPEHVRRANAIETRLVDQDLLPTMIEFFGRY